jgi:hypothetical protein
MSCSRGSPRKDIPIGLILTAIATYLPGIAAGVAVFKLWGLYLVLDARSVAFHI